MKTLVLLSGGMDSSTALALALKGSEAEAVSFNYGQRHNVELESAKMIADHFMVKHTILDLSGAAEAFSGSSLTGNGEVPEGHYEHESMKRTVVNNRNMIMLSLATGLAIGKGIDTIFYAAHAGDHAVYKDCREEFVLAMNDAIIEGNDFAPRVIAPFLDMTKADIAKLGYELGVPFDMTHTCYNGKRPHCGKCSTDIERLESFHLAGLEDPMEYEDREYWKTVCAPKPKRVVTTVSELTQSIWAVATESEVIAIDVTYKEAIEIVNANLAKSGIFIQTAESARKQISLKEERVASS